MVVVGRTIVPVLGSRADRRRHRRAAADDARSRRHRNGRRHRRAAGCVRDASPPARTSTRSAGTSRRWARRSTARSASRACPCSTRCGSIPLYVATLHRAARRAGGVPRARRDRPAATHRSRHDACLGYRPRQAASVIGWQGGCRRGSGARDRRSPRADRRPVPLAVDRREQQRSSGHRHAVGRDRLRRRRAHRSAPASSSPHSRPGPPADGDRRAT